MELWELVAREQIRHTVSAYAVAGDSGRVAELAAQFTDERWLLQHRTARVDSSVEGGWYRRTFALVG